MDTPFKKERKTEIGVEMTPGHLKQPRIVPQRVIKTVDLMKGAGGGRRSSPRPAETAAPEPAPSVKAIPRTSTPKAVSVPKPKVEKSPAPAKAKSKKFVYAAARNCIVKVDYRSYKNGEKGNASLVSARIAPFLKENGGTSTGARVGYIKREDAIEGELFTVVDNKFLACADGAVQMFGDDPTMTVILSPEDPGADLYELTRRFMRDVYNNHAPHAPRFWCAAVHGNTDHKHVHIIMTTADANGEDAQINSGYVHSGKLQGDVSDILTEIQGTRSWSETLASQKKKRNRLMFTWVDEKIFSKIEVQEDGSGKFMFSSLNGSKEAEKGKEDGKKKKSIAKVKEKVGRRLQFFKSLGLATNLDNRSGTWFLKPGTLERLKRGDFAEVFGLTETEMDHMMLDDETTPEYSGTIIESGEKDEKNLLFMIKDDTNTIHLRREYVSEEKDKTSLQEQKWKVFKNPADIRGKTQGRRK